MRNDPRTLPAGRQSSGPSWRSSRPSARQARGPGTSRVPGPLRPPLLGRLALAGALLAVLGTGWGDAGPAGAAVGGAQSPATAPEPASAADDCPAVRLVATYQDFSGRDLGHPNFSGQDLSNASFVGATLDGAVFVRAQLQGANFRNAHFKGGADFSLANLANACFIGATFDGLTYFTGADTSCADFSQTNIAAEGTGNVITKAVLFGEDGLHVRYDARECRSKFRSTRMSCEFIRDWPALDLSRADISACLDRLKGMDFGGYTPGANLSRVDFSGGASCGSGTRTDLRDTRWQGVDLTGAVFTHAILDGADFAAKGQAPGADVVAKGEAPGAVLTGANMNCIAAKGAHFDGANLGKTEHGGVGAKLDGATLDQGSFKGTNLVGTSFAGATLLDADLANATLDESNWDGATLANLDLTAVQSALGASFVGAHLDAATLKNTNLGPTSFRASGTETRQVSRFGGAILCGATLDNTNLTCADLARAKLTAAAGCKEPARIVKDRGGNYNPKTAGLDGDDGCTTTCPDGSNGPCSTEAQWNSPLPPDGDPCCPTKPCQPRLKSGEPCASDCDCHSRVCAHDFCR